MSIQGTNRGETGLTLGTMGCPGTLRIRSALKEKMGWGGAGGGSTVGSWLYMLYAFIGGEEYGGALSMPDILLSAWVWILSSTHAEHAWSAY